MNIVWEEKRPLYLCLRLCHLSKKKVKTKSLFIGMYLQSAFKRIKRRMDRLSVIVDINWLL